MKKDIKNVVFSFGLVLTLAIASANWYHQGVATAENALAARREYKQQEHIAQLEMQRLLLRSDIEMVTQVSKHAVELAAAVEGTSQTAAPGVALLADDIVKPVVANSVAQIEKNKSSAVVTKSPVPVPTPEKPVNTSATQIAAQANAAKAAQIAKEAQAAKDAALAEQVAAAKAAAQKQAATLAAKQVKTTQTATVKKTRQSRAS